MAAPETSPVTPSPKWAGLPPVSRQSSIVSRYLPAFVLLALVPLAFFLDHPLADFIGAHPFEPHGDVARELMFLEQFGQFVCSAVLILAVALLDKDGRRKAVAIAGVCVLTALACHGLKELAGRTRPGIPDPQDFTGFCGFFGPIAALTRSYSPAFPSAHTSGAFALAAALAFFYPRAVVLLFTLAILTALQRILHHAHYLSDTLAGAALALLIVRATLPRLYRQPPSL